MASQGPQAAAPVSAQWAMELEEQESALTVRLPISGCVRMTLRLRAGAAQAVREQSPGPADQHLALLNAHQRGPCVAAKSRTLACQARSQSLAPEQQR